jgi:thiamine pyrophosphate-dependent acetolactate synthase large subunit-like protein
MKLDRPEGEPDQRIGWGSDIAAEMLRRFNIPYISLNPGASYRGLHDSLVNHLGNEPPGILLRLHEDHSVAIAHGYARVTGEPMACVLHANVGLMHGHDGLFNAWCDRAPMLVLGPLVRSPRKSAGPGSIGSHHARSGRLGAVFREVGRSAHIPESWWNLARANLLTRRPTAGLYLS